VLCCAVLCPVTLLLLPPAGNFNAGGTFTTGTPFKGTLNSKNQMTVSVEGSKCELTYTLKAVGKPAPVDADDAAKPAAAAKATDGAPAPDAKAAPGASPAPKPKSSAAASSVSVVLALLCAVLVFVL
jgi:hypothetical protein